VISLASRVFAELHLSRYVRLTAVLLLLEPPDLAMPSLHNPPIASAQDFCELSQISILSGCLLICFGALS